MTLKEELQIDRPIDLPELPISGGHGKSLEDAIIISDYPDCVEVMYYVLDLLSKKRKFSYNIIQRGTSKINNKTFNIFEIEITKDNSTEIVKYFFDITEYFS